MFCFSAAPQANLLGIRSHSYQDEEEEESLGQMNYSPVQFEEQNCRKKDQADIARLQNSRPSVYQSIRSIRMNYKFTTDRPHANSAMKMQRQHGVWPNKFCPSGPRSLAERIGTTTMMIDPHARMRISA